jgi:hypothetical protein
MRIVELNEYSMIVMKDSEDPPWISVGNIYRTSKDKGLKIAVSTDVKIDDSPVKEPAFQVSNDSVYTAGRLVLFFGDPISPKFKNKLRVSLLLVGNY